MTRLLSWLVSLALMAPAFAQERPAPAAAVGAGMVRYSAAAQRLPDGQYRAEVRRANGAGGSDEIAWSSAPHATMPQALREACKMIETAYAPGTTCPTAANASARKTPVLASEGKPVTKAAVSAKAKVGEATPASGYQVRGCAFYALVDGRVLQRCPREGSPGTKPFWHNEDAFEGGYGGWGR